MNPDKRYGSAHKYSNASEKFQYLTFVSGYLNPGFHFQVGDYVLRGYNNIREMFHKRDKLIDIKETVKLASDDGVVTYDEVRERLRKQNFSDLEIEIFCAR